MGIPNVYNAISIDKYDEYIIFNISNNVQSSSVLALSINASVVPFDKTTLTTYFLPDAINAFNLL